MALYLIETTKGPRGPYTTEDVLRGTRKGTLPLGAQLINQETGETTTAADVVGAAQPASAPAEPTAPAVRLPQRRPAGYTQPRHPAYQQPPAQPNYAQQPAYPYPGNAGPQYPQYGHQPQVYQPYGQQMPYPTQVTPPTSGLAIASLVLSLVTFTFCLPLWIGGIICGLIALGHCQPNGPKAGRGLALAGIWTGVGIGLLYVGGIAWFFWMETGQSW